MFRISYTYNVKLQLYLSKIPWLNDKIHSAGTSPIPERAVTLSLINSMRQETWVRSLGQEDPLEKGMATYSKILVALQATLSETQLSD